MSSYSHFNLATALELRLKCLLQLHEIVPESGNTGHLLAGLYVQLGESGKPSADKLEFLFQEAIADHPLELVAFLSTHTSDRPEGPSEKPLATLKDFFDYLDIEAELWKKRYSWESADGGRWQHYMDDLGALLRFLDSTEIVAKDLARKRGIVRSSTERSK